MVGDLNSDAIQKKVYQGLRSLNLIDQSEEEISLGSHDPYFLSLCEHETVIKLFHCNEMASYQALITMNIRRFYLASHSFGKSWSVHAINCATIFVLLGCLLDQWLDNGNDQLRHKARLILDWENGCGKYFIGKKRDKDTLITSMLSELGDHLEEIKKASPHNYDLIISELRRAIEAEVKGMNTSNSAQDLPYAKDKSVLFVLVSFLFASSGNLLEDEIQFCRMIGEVMSLVDDLCDLVEDVKHNQINSILCCSDGSEDLLLVIDEALQTLGCNLKLLRENLSTEFYNFLLYNLRKWALGNEYIRSRVLRCSHG